MKDIRNLNFSDVQQTVASHEGQYPQTLKLAFLRNIVVEPIEPYLAYLALQLECSLDASFGGYDTVLQDALSGLGGGINNETDAILIFYHLDQSSQFLSRRFATLSYDQINEEVQNTLNYVFTVIKSIRKHSSALVLWHSFEYQPFPAFGAVDFSMADGQNNTIARLNEGIRDFLASDRWAKLIDMNAIIIRMGVDRFYDRRNWHLAKSPYSLEALSEIALENFRLIRAVRGGGYKCVVVDCDNTLWGGVIGEDGIGEIKLGTTFPGSAYREFQQELVNLHHLGVLVALSSKNNPEDVWNVFDTHDGMILKREHVVAHRLNWDDKADNIISIAKQLNIGLDSIVFIDDSVFEIERVRRSLPEVATLHFDSKKPHEYRHALLKAGFFDLLYRTSEDRERTNLYRAEEKRQAELHTAEDVEAFLSTLELRAHVAEISMDIIPRVAQLTQKTNQFNLTTRRYSEDDIISFHESEDYQILSVFLDDKFGSYGMIGVCILKYSSQNILIDTFLLSCRALGRNVEDVMLWTIMKIGKQKVMSKIIGDYIPSKKNAQVANFYQSHGFNSCEDKLVFDLSNNHIEIPHYISVTYSISK